MKEVVVLIHGFCAHGFTMHFIKKALRKAGYDVVVLSYITAFTNRDIDFIGSRFSDDLNREYGAQYRLHFVGHSLGGVIIRSIMSKYRRYEIGNIVTIGSPHYGCLAADWTEKWIPPLKFILGMGIFKDMNRHSKTVHELPSLPHHGVVLGMKDRKPWLPTSFMVPSPSDGLVEHRSSLLEGYIDVAKTNSDHFSQLWNKDVLRYVVHFIKNGRFA